MSADQPAARSVKRAQDEQELLAHYRVLPPWAKDHVFIVSHIAAGKPITTLMRAHLRVLAALMQTHEEGDVA